MYKEIDLDRIDTTGLPPENDPERQYFFLAKCREQVHGLEQKRGRRLRACVVNMGCPMVIVTRICRKS